MNRLNLNYSLKNIPDPSKLQYETELVNKVKTFVKKLDWDLFFKVHPTDTNNPTPNSFGFKSNKGVPYFNELNKLKRIIQYSNFVKKFKKKIMTFYIG